jgi:pyruvate dehydrogenase E2 component (dihydrolipoamide acetyltransferase)
VQPTRMRTGIARRMQESKQQAPHFYAQAEITMDPVLAELERLNARDPSVRITVTAALVRACAEALGAHRMFNSIWTDEGLLEADDINIGVAVALDEGLLAPALLGADRLGLSGLATALHDLVERARAQRLRPSEISQATFTLSNLGMFDISAFTAIITPPQVAILATARPAERWKLEDGEPARAAVMTATLSADHRAVDGIDAARFLETFKMALETPGSLLSEPTRVNKEMS